MRSRKRIFFAYFPFPLSYPLPAKFLVLFSFSCSLVIPLSLSLVPSLLLFPSPCCPGPLFYVLFLLCTLSVESGSV